MHDKVLAAPRLPYLTIVSVPKAEAVLTKIPEDAPNHTPAQALLESFRIGLRARELSRTCGGNTNWDCCDEHASLMGRDLNLQSLLVAIGNVPHPDWPNGLPAGGPAWYWAYKLDYPWAEPFTIIDHDGGPGDHYISQFIMISLVRPFVEANPGDYGRRRRFLDLYLAFLEYQQKLQQGYLMVNLRRQADQLLRWARALTDTENIMPYDTWQLHDPLSSEWWRALGYDWSPYSLILKEPLV